MVDRAVKVTLRADVLPYIEGMNRADRSTERLGRSAASTAGHVEHMKREIAGASAAIRSLPENKSVRVTIELRGVESVRAEIARINARNLKVRAQLDTSTWRREAERAAKGIRVSIRSNLRVDVRGSLDRRQLQRDLDRMRLHVRVFVRPTIDPTSRRVIQSQASSLGSSAGGAFGSRFAKLAGVGAIFLPQAVSAMSALTAGSTALAGSLGSVVGLAGALPALFASAASAIGSIGFSLGGIKDAVKAYDKPASGGGGGGASAVAQQRSMQAAIRQVTLAQRGLTRATEEELQAREDLNDAYRTAEERLQDLRDRQVDNALAEERATLAVRDAQQALDDARFFGRDTTEEDLALREQIQALAEIRTQRARDSREQQVAAAKGVQGSDEVTAAQRRIQDAAESTADAQYAVADAIQAQSDAMSQAAGGGGGVDQLAEALRNLSPEQQKFAKFLYSLKPQLQELRATAASGLLPGLTESITGSLKVLPLLNTQLNVTGKTLGSLSGEAVARFTSADSINRLTVALRSGDDVTRGLGRSSIYLGDALLDVTVAAAPMVRKLADAAENSSRLVAQFTKGKAASGELSASFDRIYGRASILANTLGKARSALAGTFEAGMDTGDSFLVSLDQVVTRWDDWVDSIEGQAALKKWFREGREAASEFGGLLGDIRKEFSGLTDNADASDFIRQIRSLVPAVADLLKSLSGSGSTGQVLVESIKEMAHALDRLNAGGAIRTFITTIAGIATAVADLVEIVPFGAEQLQALVVVLGLLKVAALIAGPITAATAAIKGLAGASSLASIGLTPLKAALLVAGAVALGFAKNKQEAAARTREFTAAIQADSGAVGENTRKTAIANLEKAGTLRTLEKLGISTKLATDATLGDVEAQKELTKQGKARKAAIDDLSFSEKQSLSALKETSTAIEKGSDAYKRQEAAIGAAAVETKQLTIAQQLAADLAKKQADNFDILASSTSTVTDKVRAAREQLDLLNNGAFVDAERASIAYNKALTDLGEAAKTNGRSLDVSTAAGQANRQAILDASDAVYDQIAAIRASNDPIDVQRTKIAGIVTEFDKQATAAYGAKGGVEELLGQLGLVPAKTELIFEATGIDAASIKIRALTTLVNGLQTAAGVAGKLDRLDQGVSRAQGGEVWGRGTSTSDSIPAWLSTGEFVTKAASARLYGMAAMHAVNQGRAEIRYARGGQVKAVMPPKPSAGWAPSRFAAGGPVQLSPRQPVFVTGGSSSSVGEVDLSTNIGELVVADPKAFFRERDIRQQQAISRSNIRNRR